MIGFYQRRNARLTRWTQNNGGHFVLGMELNSRKVEWKKNLHVNLGPSQSDNYQMKEGEMK